MVEAIVGAALRAILASVVLGGALALLVLAATRALALTAATRHALWTTALIATAAMPLAGIGMPLARAALAATSPQQLAATSPQQLASTDTSARDAVGPYAEPQGRQHVRPQRQRQAAEARAMAIVPGAEAARPPSLAQRFAAWTPRVPRLLALAVAIGWALGVLAGLANLLASVVRVRGLRRRSSPLDAALADELPWLTAAGPGREIYLRLSYETETPVAIGFRRPVILIPTELAGAGGLAAIEPLVLHEHAHLRRYDDWTNLVQRTIERLFWFNPVVWLVGRRIALEREIAADDAVVAKTGAPKAYAASLWQLAREMRMPEHAVVAPGALLTRKQISVRIEQILAADRAKLHRSPAAALGVATAAAFAVLFVATSAPAIELPPVVPPVPPVSTVAQVAPASVPVPPAAPARPPVVPSAPAAAHARPHSVHRTRTEQETLPDEDGLDAEIERTVHAALATVPAAIAAGRNEARGAHARLDGTRLSRALIAACAGCSLRNADAHGLDLHGIRLTAADLSHADLHGANLAGIRFAGVDLSHADLRDADLTGARFDGCDLSGADLRGARTAGLQLNGSTLE